jgi:LPXTG-motif cell wall-anchored protein
LLANDGAPPGVLGLLSTSAADPFRVVSVYGFDGGTAVLRRDGQIEVQADAPGSFTYAVADDAGETGSARVFVKLAAAPPTTQPTTTPPPPSPPTTDPPTTTSPTSPTINVPTTTPPGQGAGTPTTSPAVTLPATGADAAQRLRLAVAMLLAGVVLVLVVRRRNPASRSG